MKEKINHFSKPPFGIKKERDSMGTAGLKTYIALYKQASRKLATESHLRHINEIYLSVSPLNNK